MSERRYVQDLNKLQKELQLHQFMVYCYKTSFCPQIKDKHDWPVCNYAHRLQDFRRPPQNFFYRAEWCMNIHLDETFAECPDGLNCEKCHNLMEFLFNPFHYKANLC